jgi:hypothetical protein
MRAALLALGVAVVLCPAGTAGASLLPPPLPLPTVPPPPDLTGPIGDLLGTLGPAPAPDGGGSSPGGGGSPSAGGGSESDSSTGTMSSGAVAGAPGAVPVTTATTADTRAPRVKLKLLSRFAWVARTGRLKVRVTSDEQGVVAVGGTARVRHKVLHLRASVLGYRSAKAKTATVELPRAALRELARARSVRLSLQALAVDVARNQRTTALKVTLTRGPKVAHLRPAPRLHGRRAVDSPR